VAKKLVITYGADPEFCIYERATKRTADACSVINGASLSSSIGHDGCSCTGELRLPPASNADGAFKALKTLLKVELPKRLDLMQYDVIAGSGTSSQCTGGHIHIGGLGRNPTPQILNNVWRFISVPLNSISDSEYRRNNYGGKEDYHTQERYNGFEIRSPLSWIVTPRISKGVFVITSIIAQNAATDFHSWDALLDKATKSEAASIASYRKEIAWFTSSNTKLEDISVVKAWRRRNISKCKTTSLATGFHVIAFSHDMSMNDIFYTSQRNPVCRIPLRVVGARSDRTEEKAILLPKNWDYVMPDAIWGVKVLTWEHPSIGLSRALRNDPVEAKRFFIQFIKMLNRQIKKREKEKALAHPVPVDSEPTIRITNPYSARAYEVRATERGRWLE
jgi:hypothetical protein